MKEAEGSWGPGQAPHLLLDPVSVQTLLMESVGSGPSLLPRQGSSCSHKADRCLGPLVAIPCCRSLGLCSRRAPSESCSRHSESLPWRSRPPRVPGLSLHTGLPTGTCRVAGRARPCAQWPRSPTSSCSPSPVELAGEPGRPQILLCPGGTCVLQTLWSKLGLAGGVSGTLPTRVDSEASEGHLFRAALTPLESRGTSMGGSELRWGSGGVPDPRGLF